MKSLWCENSLRRKSENVFCNLVSPSSPNTVVTSAVQLVIQTVECIAPIRFKPEQNHPTFPYPQDSGAIISTYRFCSASIPLESRELFIRIFSIPSEVICDQKCSDCQASRCLLSRRTFSFLFLFPCFFQGLPATISDSALPGPTGPLPGL